MRVGCWDLALFPGGYFRLDGGAMFGTVPKTLWAKLMVPDEQNRIRMTCNVLLAMGYVEGHRRVVVVETGCGSKGDESFRRRLGLEDPEALVEGLRARGLAPGDVTDVVLTHLHLDHAGGLTHCDGRGRVVPTFPGARHWVQRQELEDARQPSMRARASYLRDDWEPVLRAGLFHPVEGEAELMQGLRVRPFPGHNQGQQGVIFEGDGKRLVYAGDLIPTRHHLPPTWAMAYDLDVNTCVETRLSLLESLCGTEDLLVLDHEVDHPIGRVKKDERGRYLWEPIEIG